MSTPGKRDTGSGRPMRADARSNRGRILEVADEVFGKGGESASTEEVARLAGVGIATVFRHFPTKAALVEAVLVRRFDHLRERAEALLDATDPGTAFFDFFSHLVADAATKITIGEALHEAGGDRDGDAGVASNALRGAVAALLRQAQHAGAVRGRRRTARGLHPAGRHVAGRRARPSGPGGPSPNARHCLRRPRAVLAAPAEELGCRA
jgi:AcrR family transcriptional regulator